MKKYIILLGIMLLTGSLAYAGDAKKDCLSGEGKTVDDAFKVGVALAKGAGLQLGGEEGKARLHILPKNGHGVYVVKVCHSSLDSGKVRK